MTDPLAEKIGINVQGGTVNVQNLNIGIAERLAESGDRVRILVVAANPLGSSPLKLDHEVKTIQEALRRSRKRDNFVVEYRLAATPSELRRALLDVEPHVLHFSGHGAGDRGLLFVSDESASAIYRSEGGEVRSRATNSNEIKFVPAKPLASLLQLCDDHLECVVLNACYSDVQGDAIAANIPFTIGMRDAVEDNVAIKFSQGFYDAIGAGKGYEKAFEWGKAAIEVDLAHDSAAKIFVLRKRGEKAKTDEQNTNALHEIQTSHGVSQFTIGFSSWVFFVLSVTGIIILIIQRSWLHETKRSFPSPTSASIATAPSPSSTPTSIPTITTAPSPLSTSTSIPTITTAPSPSSTPTSIPTITTVPSPSSTPTISNKTSENFFNDGLSKQKKGDNAGAIADYNEAIRLNYPNLAGVYHNRFLAKYNLGDKQGALADYNEAIRLNPDISQAYRRTNLNFD